MATKTVTKKDESAVKTATAKTVAPAAAKPVAVKSATAEKKKPVTKKTTAKKEIKVKAVVEYCGKQVEEKDMISAVKKAWTKTGKKVGDIKTMELYIKPEEGAVYYVVNDTHTGAVPF